MLDQQPYLHGNHFSRSLVVGNRAILDRQRFLYIRLKQFETRSDHPDKYGDSRRNKVVHLSSNNC